MNMSSAAQMHLVQTTHADYLQKHGKAPWVNALGMRKYFLGRLMARAKIDTSGSPDIRSKIALEGDNGANWLLPMEVLEAVGPTSPHEVRAGYRYLYKAWALSEQDARHNRGPDQIINLPEYVRELMMTACAKSLEEAVFEPTGSFDHYAEGPDAKVMQGIKYWITPDGLAPDGSASVGGINASTLGLWQNQRITPVGSTDIGPNGSAFSSPITSADELHGAMQRMIDILGFSSPEGIPSIKHMPKTQNNPNRSEHWIVGDYRSIANYRASRFNREDNVRYDQFRELPTFNGVPMEFSPLLGIGPGGLWRDNNSVDLFAGGARTGGNFDSGTRPNTGELFFINLKYFRVFVDSEWSPGFRPPFPLPQQHGTAHWVSWWLNTICLARHLHGYIGLYENDLRGWN